MNKSYIKGRNKEYRIKKKLEQEGYYVIRSAGSHSYFDLVAINTEKKEILLVQVKTRIDKKTEELYKNLEKEFNGVYNVKIVLMS
jgi:Archaeal holliday junction resolvase (hjc).